MQEFMKTCLEEYEYTEKVMIGPWRDPRTERKFRMGGYEQEPDPKHPPGSGKMRDKRDWYGRKIQKLGTW